MSRAFRLNSLPPTSMSTTLLPSSSLSADMMPPSSRRASRVLRLAMGTGFDFDEDVAVLPIAAVEKLMGNAGFAPDRVSRLLVRFADAAVIECHLVFALRQRHDEIGQQMLVPWLPLSGVERDAPHAHQFVLEHDLIANRSQHAHGCNLPAMIRYRSAPACGRPTTWRYKSCARAAPIAAIAAMWSSGLTSTKVSRGQPMSWRNRSPTSNNERSRRPPSSGASRWETMRCFSPGTSAGMWGRRRTSVK